MLRFRRITALFLTILLTVTVVLPVSAASADDALSDTAKWLQKNVTNPVVASVGGEWAVIGLSRSDVSVPQKWYDTYYKNVETYVKACGGVLHNRKYTEYSRVVLALTAIGKDPTNVAGYDLTAPLNNYEKTVWQGINGPIWALIALDSGNYACSVRQKYIDCILEKELPQGGWTLTGSAADSDMTGMALQALANYQDQPKVKAAIDRALVWISKNQNANGGFSTYGEATCESTAQIIVALCTLGIDLKDSRFVKNGSSALDGLLTVNFASVQDGVVIYPELIKLQLSMADGSIVGMDAEGYLRNPRERTFPEAIIDAETARAKISPKLNAESAQLCVIPKDGREYFTWEIRAADEGAGYLVYVDAQNGIERDLMQIVSAGQGTLVM